MRLCFLMTNWSTTSFQKRKRAGSVVNQLSHGPRSIRQPITSSPSLGADLPPTRLHRYGRRCLFFYAIGAEISSSASSRSASRGYDVNKRHHGFASLLFAMSAEGRSNTAVLSFQTSGSAYEVSKSHECTSVLVPLATRSPIWVLE